MSAPESPTLPPPMVDFLDGTRLHEKIGTALLLISCDPSGWPRLAMLSVGEVLAMSPHAVHLALYQGSRTTQAVARSGQALLFLPLGAAIHKVELSITRSFGEDHINRFFRAEVAGVTADSVAYADITHGIEYRLHDEQAVLSRWRHQIELLSVGAEA